MNKKKLMLKIIPTFILVVFLVSVFQFTPLIRVEAANSMGDLYSNPNQSNSKNPYKFNIKSVVNSSMLTSVVGCTNVVNKVSLWMSKFLLGEKYKEMIKKAAQDKVREQIMSACKSGEAAATGAAGAAVQVNDLVTAVKVLMEKTSLKVGDEKVKACAQEVNSIDSELLYKQAEANKKAEEVAFKEQCLDGIAITLAKNQLTAMTRSAVNWVNSGYGGNPFFVQSMTNLTNNLEKNVLETGTDILINKEFGNPYARGFAKSSITAYKSGRGIGQSGANFLGGLQSDLGSFITNPKSYYTDEQLNGAEDTRDALQKAREQHDAFANDFSVGGWNGWLALTQRDQNNPLGFTMLASQYLAGEQEKKINEIKDELTQNNGFLSQKTCVLWQLYDKDGKPLQEPNPDYEVDPDNQPKTQNVYKEKKSDSGFDQCKKWKTITPGSIIKDKTTSYLNSPERQLELAKTINDALNALFSVLISKLESNGLSGLSDSAVSTNWTDSFNTINESGWGDSSNPYDNNGAYNNFNLTRDLGNTYIHEKTYKIGTWDASNNTTSDLNNLTLYPDLAPVYYLNNNTNNSTSTKNAKINKANLGIDSDEMTTDEKNIPQITSNTYFTVSKAGYTELVKDGYNGWAVGDRAFWNGSEWQNWKCGENKEGNCTNQLSPIKKRGVIQIQQDYIVATKEIVKFLPNVMTKLGELDYCIPGPNPNYKANSSDAQSAFSDLVGSLRIADDDSKKRNFDPTRPEMINLKNIYSDNPNMWEFVFGDAIKNPVHDPWKGINYLVDRFGCERTHHPTGRCLSGGDQTLLDLWNNYINNSMFKNFYEMFDKVMNELYFKSMTNPYLEDESKPIDFQKDKNPAYIPMAESGLDITKNITTYDEDINKAISDYNDSISQAKINIAKLEPIKAEVSQIIRDAQKRRDDKLLIKLTAEAEEMCKIESQDCLRGVGVPSTINKEDLGEYCLAKNKDCVKKNTMTEAQYKTKYAGCLEEEDIQVFDVDALTKTGIVDQERCFNGFDDDFDGLVDSKDPDCRGATNNNGGVVVETKKCVLGVSTTNEMGYPNNKKCSDRKTESECTKTDYYHGTLANVCDWGTGQGITEPTVSKFGCNIKGTGKKVNKPENKNCLIRTEDECTKDQYVDGNSMGYTCEFKNLPH